MKSCCCYIQAPFTVPKYFDGFHLDVFDNIIFFQSYTEGLERETVL